MSNGNSMFEQLGQYIEDAMQRYHVPGAAVGIQYEGREYTAGFGVTNVNHPLPVDGDTLFQIGSTTKTFTATTMMRLADQGHVELDAPVRKYLPAFRLQDEDAAGRVTVRQLFTHTGGWLGDFFEDTGSGDDALARYVAQMAEIPQLAPLGTVWSYNNAALAVAGRVIETVTGKTYEAALAALVLKPLGLGMTFIWPTDVMTHGFAVGHIVHDEKPVVAEPWPLARSAHAVGGLTSTAKDQLRYARFHMGDGRAEDGTRVLKPESVAHMQARIIDAPLGEEMGLSWYSRRTDGGHILRHGGGTNGQLSAFWFVPERRFAFTLLTNADRGAELLRDATRWAMQHYLGISDPEPARIAMGEEQLKAYAGRYTAQLYDVELTVRDGQLMMQVRPHGGFPLKDSPPPPTPPPSRVAFTGVDRLVALDPPHTDVPGEFLRNANGSIEWFRFGGRVRRREA